MIEIAVTLSIVGMLVAATLPSISDWIHATQVRNMAETLQNGLQKARNEAMKRNKVVTLWLVSPAATPRPDANCELSAGSGAWVISLDDPTHACDTAASPSTAPRIVETYGPGTGGATVTVAAADKSGNAAASVSFNGFGQPVAGSTPIDHIDIQHADASARRLTVQISASGGIRMCDRDVVAPDTRACN